MHFQDLKENDYFNPIDAKVTYRKIKTVKVLNLEFNCLNRDTDKMSYFQDLENVRKIKRFANLKVDTIFEFNARKFIKISKLEEPDEEYKNAICLEDGCLCCFEDLCETFEMYFTQRESDFRIPCGKDTRNFKYV